MRNKVPHLIEGESYTIVLKGIPAKKVAALITYFDSLEYEAEVVKGKVIGFDEISNFPDDAADTLRYMFKS